MRNFLRTSVQDKVLEAEFFLRLARERAKEPDPFRWLFGAFVIATRSVAWLIPSEYKTRPGFDAWWDPRWTQLSSEPLWLNFLDLRDRTMHVWALTAGELGDPHDRLIQADALFEKVARIADEAVATWN